MEITSHIVTTPPRDAASIVLVRDGAQGLEVFLMRRASQSDVLGGAYVFPGGKVDAADQALATELALDAPHDHLAQRLAEPGLSELAAASFYVAAVREAFEECGVLFAHGGGGQAGATAAQAAAPSAPDGFAGHLRALGATLTVSALHPWSRWITPRQASLMNKRFDTRFFLAAMPEGQHARHDDFETTHSEWMTPRDALTRYWAREFDMAPPQIMSLVQLVRHASVADALAEARLRQPPTIEPAPFDHEGMRVICYPGDERHPQPLRVVPGPTRLMFRNKRFEPATGTLDELLAPAS